MKSRQTSATVCIVILAATFAIFVGTWHSSDAFGYDCTTKVGAAHGPFASGVTYTVECSSTTATTTSRRMPGTVGGGGQSTPPSQTATIDCGRAGATWNTQCGEQVACTYTDNATGQTKPADTFATFERGQGGRLVPVAYCADNTSPQQPDGEYFQALIREEAERLLPAVALRGSAVPNTLIRIETIMWADTPVDRSLGAVTLLGQRVSFKIKFKVGNWDYGDGTSEQRPTPGNAYPSLGTCNTPICARYDGHVYTKGGPITVHLTVTWDATYSLDGVTYQPIQGGPITGPTSTLAYVVRTAHAVLVDH